MKKREIILVLAFLFLLVLLIVAYLFADHWKQGQIEKRRLQIQEEIRLNARQRREDSVVAMGQQQREKEARRQREAERVASTIEFAVFSGGNLTTLGTYPVPEKNYYHITKPVETRSGRVYFATEKSVFEFDVLNKELHEVYQETASGARILDLYPSEGADGGLVVTRSYASPLLEGYGDHELVYFTDGFESERVLMRKRESKIYTRLRYLGETEGGDSIICFCGGEGGGSWGEYYRLQSDGDIVDLLNQSPEEYTQTSYVDYFPSLESILLHKYEYKYSLDGAEGMTSDYMLLNVMTGETKEKPFLLDINIYYADPEQLELLAMNEENYVLYSLSDEQSSSFTYGENMSDKNVNVDLLLNGTIFGSYSTRLIEAYERGVLTISGSQVSLIKIAKNLSDYPHVIGPTERGVLVSWFLAPEY